MELLPLRAAGRQLEFVERPCGDAVYDSQIAAHQLPLHAIWDSPRHGRQAAPLLLNCFAEDVALAPAEDLEESRNSIPECPRSARAWSSRLALEAVCWAECCGGGHTKVGAQDGLTQTQAAFSLVTAVLGCGVVALPSLMRLGGWIAVPTLAAATSVAFMEVARVMDGALVIAEVGGNSIKSFEELGRAATGMLGVVLVRCITTLGFCGTLVVYTILIGQNVHAIFGRACPLKWVMVLVMPVLMVCAMTTDMKSLSRFMPIGVTASVSSCILICIKASSDAHIWQAWPQEWLPDVHSTWPSEPESLGTIIAVLFSAFSVMGTVPCIRGSMQRPAEFLPAFRAAMCVVCLAYLAVMFFGYWGYGNFVQANVVQSMMFSPGSPREAFEEERVSGVEVRQPSALGTLMAVLVTIYLLLGFGLFFVCVMGTVQQLGNAGAAWSTPGNWANSLLRAVIVMACCAIGVVIPHFREIMSIMSSVCCSCNNVFFPMVFAYRLNWSTCAKPTPLASKAFHFCIFLLAVFCAVYGVRDSGSKLAAKMSIATL